MYCIVLQSLEKMAGLNEYNNIHGYAISNTYPSCWANDDYTSGRGPAKCELCRQDGTFEGVFYGLCMNCCEKLGPCQCVNCRGGKEDNHKIIERRQNICKLIKDLRMVVNDLKHDYPTDEYGIVKEGIESGFYILDLHTKQQYSNIKDVIIRVVTKEKYIVGCNVCGKSFLGGPLTLEIACSYVCKQCTEESEFGYCKECNDKTMLNELDMRGYCLICQNPDHDVGWPKGY